MENFQQFFCIRICCCRTEQEEDEDVDERNKKFESLNKARYCNLQSGKSDDVGEWGVGPLEGDRASTHFIVAILDIHVPPAPTEKNLILK